MQRVSPKTQSRLGLILLAFIAFISLGLPDGLLGVAWPSIRANFSRSLDSLGIWMFASMVGYMSSSFMAGKTMAKLGVGGLLAASCAMTGAALLGYTLAPAWWVIVALGVLAGLGAGAIDAGINTYIAANFGEGLMQWLHASFGVGITLGPIIMTAGLTFFKAWRWGYVVVGSAQLLLALCFLLTVKMWEQDKQQPKHEDDRLLTDYKTPLLETLRQPRTWLSILLFFIYTGTEIGLGAWAYTLLTESRGVDPTLAGFVTGSYWFTFTVGRVLAGLYARRIGLHKLITGGLALALTGMLLLWWSPSEWVSVLGVALTGFAVAPIFPGLVSGTSGRVSPRHAANTIGMQIAGAGLGGSLIPGLAGVLAERISLEVIPAYLSLLIALLIVLYIASTRKMDTSREDAPGNKPDLAVPPADWKEFIHLAYQENPKNSQTTPVFRPAASAEEILAAEEKLGAAIPGPLRALLSQANGFTEETRLNGSEKSMDTGSDFLPVARIVQFTAYYRGSRLPTNIDFSEMVFFMNTHMDGIYMANRITDGAVYAWYPMEGKFRLMSETFEKFIWGWPSGSVKV